MGGGKVTPGFPHPDPVESYWQVPPHRIANHRTTEAFPTDKIFDYIIIGSGVSGAAIAYKLYTRNKNLSILMIEARTAASAASGRNGGHCRPSWWAKFKGNAKLYGVEEALKLEKLETQNVQDIVDFVKEHNVDCDFRDVETCDTFTSKESWDKIVDIIQYRREIEKSHPTAGPGGPQKIYYGEEANKKMKMENLVGAVAQLGHTQNPYLLVCKMLELDLEKGLNLQTNTLATQVRPDTADDNTSGHVVETDRGIARGRKVVLATNSYTSAIHPALAKTGFLTPSRSQVTAVRPGSNVHNVISSDRSYYLANLGYGDYFFQRQPGLKGQGDILYGGGNAVDTVRGISDDSVVNPKIAEYLQHAAYKYYGHEAWGDEGERVKAWGGIVGYTADSLPIVGEDPAQKGLWMSVGMNGHGSKCLIISNLVVQ